MKGCWHTATLADYERQIDAEDVCSAFRDEWIKNNHADMVARLLGNADYRGETLGDFWREADVAYAAALAGESDRCASIIADLLRKAAAEDADKLLRAFALESFYVDGPKYEDMPGAWDVKTRWDA